MQAVEIGAGHTILSYEGGCGNIKEYGQVAMDTAAMLIKDNIEEMYKYWSIYPYAKSFPQFQAANARERTAESGHYFHVASLGHLTAASANGTNTFVPSAWAQKYIDKGYKNFAKAYVGVLSKCGKVTKTGNQRPTATVQPTCEIPRLTAYELVGFGSDPDTSDQLAYNWEQIDAAVVQAAFQEENKGKAGVKDSAGPLVESVRPTAGGSVRYIPKMCECPLPGLNRNNNTTDFCHLCMFTTHLCKNCCSDCGRIPILSNRHARSARTHFNDLGM